MEPLCKKPYHAGKTTDTSDETTRQSISRTFILKIDLLRSWGSVRSSRWMRRAVLKMYLYSFTHPGIFPKQQSISLVLKPSKLLLPCKPDDCLKSQNKLFKQLIIIGWYPVLKLLGLARWNEPFLSIYGKGTSLNNHKHGC